MHSCTHHRFAASYLSVSPLPPLFRPSLASQKRVGFFVSDRSTQTEESDILEVKRITHVIETLIQVWGILPCCYCSSSPWLPQACSWPSAHKGIQDHVELLFLISDFQLRIQCVKKSLFPPKQELWFIWCKVHVPGRSKVFFFHSKQGTFWWFINRCLN